MRALHFVLVLLIMISAGMTGALAAPFADAPLKLDQSSESGSGSSIAKAVTQKMPGFHVRVAAYNIAHARGEESGGLKEIGKPSKLKGIAQLIKDNKISIVGFTEISQGDLRVLFRNQPKFIAKYLGYHHVYEQNYKRGLFGKLATQGNAIVSKYPIVSHKNHNLYKSDEKHEQRSCLEAVIDLGKPGKIKILVAHLSLKADESTKQIEEIWKIAETSKEPVILLGDFNSRPGSARIKWLSQRMIDTSANLNTTFKNKPDVKIDYHFIRGPWQYGTCRVIGFDLDYSDHGCVFNDYWLQNTKK
ncbi:MAG TPA: hypothetical protein DCG57_07685 [Candidatus Riflebacteria bacterium]|jgi:endonuclease/exonuclease/phosphatase family metal-dependent hydrolase|nr:hypothetical protein [Candidatus Riflebacteria bacterium]